MSSIPPSPGPARSTAELNAAIRALWSHPQVPLTAEQRADAVIFGRALYVDRHGY